jgi:hypothetical protein
MASNEPKVKTSVETMAYYNMILIEAIFQLLEEKLLRPKEVWDVDTKEGKVTASVEEIATYNMILTEAIYELLADKGIVSKEEVMERVRKLKAETTVNFRRVQWSGGINAGSIEWWGRISTRDSAGPSSILTIWALNVDDRVRLPTRCSIWNSWKAAGEAWYASMNGEASAALTRSQKPESSLTSGLALWLSKPTKQIVILWERDKAPRLNHSLSNRPGDYRERFGASGDLRLRGLHGSNDFFSWHMHGETLVPCLTIENAQSWLRLL